VQCIVLALLCAVAVPLVAATATVPREGIEWCDIWIPNAEREMHPRVLIIGDSITKQYTPEVEIALQGVASVARFSTSRCIGDPVLLTELTLVLSQYPFDVIHVNNGLHGWANSEAVYEANFDEFLNTITKLAPNAKIIWATTTPLRVKDHLENLQPNNERVKARNVIAATHIANRPIAVDDLYVVTEAHPEFFSDGTHYNKDGVSALAKQVSASIRAILPPKP
jgi:hypothetical protein